MPAKLPWLKGVFPALVTPFDKDEEIDEGALRALVRHLLPGDVLIVLSAGDADQICKSVLSQLSERKA